MIINVVVYSGSESDFYLWQQFKIKYIVNYLIFVNKIVFVYEY